MHKLLKNNKMFACFLSSSEPEKMSMSALPGAGKQDRVKLAIKSEPMLAPMQPLLLDVAQNLPLVSIIRDVCERWSVDYPDRYSFKYVDVPSSAGGTQKFGYITEDNRGKLRNGDILRIALTPAISAKETFNALRSKHTEAKSRGITELSIVSKDRTFAFEFFKLEGVTCLMETVELSQLSTDHDIHQVVNTLGAFQELMEHGIVSWDSLTDNFVKKLINFTDKSLNSMEYYRPQIVSNTLAILESIILNSTKFNEIVSKEISVATTIPFLTKTSVDVKYNTLAFINAMISKSPDRVDELKVNNFNGTILEHILNHFQGNTPQEIAHELYVYQSHVLNLVEGRMKMRFVPGDPKMEDDVRVLPTRAFPDEYSGSKLKVPITEQHWKQLGFLKGDPQDDFNESPPGVLALDCMVYFAKTKHDVFTRLLFSYSDSQCPFAQTSIALTKVLCQMLRVGEPPSEIGYDYVPVLVWSEEPFKEVFCVVIQLLFKTWREMRASFQDLEKVMVVVTKQINTVIVNSGLSLTSFEILRNKLFDLSYKKITQTEESSQLLDEKVLKSKPVQELCERIKPDIVQLVRQERLRHLVEGAAFPRSARRRDQFFYCRLSPNHKLLHFMDTTNPNQTPSIEQMEKKIQVSELRLEMGAACPHASTLRRSHTPHNIFSIFYEGEEHLDFIAPNETVFNIWVDGLSVLSSKPMPSKSSEEDIEALLNMDLKLRLLDIENVSIPSTQPAIPKEPTEFDFYYKLDN